MSISLNNHEQRIIYLENKENIIPRISNRNTVIEVKWGFSDITISKTGWYLACPNDSIHHYMLNINNVVKIGIQGSAQSYADCNNMLLPLHSDDILKIDRYEWVSPTNGCGFELVLLEHQ